MMLDDRYALAAIAAQDLASVLAATAGQLPLTQAQGRATNRAAFAVSSVLAPAIQTAADVAYIARQLGAAIATIRATMLPLDVAPILYSAAAASVTAAPTFASPARTQEAALARMLAECLEASWLGWAFVAEAQTPFGDRQAAVAARARIAAAMDASLDRIAANTGQGVVDLLGNVARTASDHIATTAADLKPVVMVSSARSAPSTALAFALYGDPSRAGELVARNKVATPLFMPTSIEALAPGA